MASREIRRLKKKEEEKKEKGGFATSTFSVIILVIIIVSFLIADYFRAPGSSAGKISFGSYQGKEITWEPGNFFSRMVETTYNNREEQLKSQLQAAKTPEEKEQIQKQIQGLSVTDIFQGSFQGITYHIAVLQEAERSGLRVSDKRIQEAIVDYFQFELARYEDKKQRENRFLDIYSQQRDYFKETLIELQYKYDRRGLLFPPSLMEFQNQYNWDFNNLLSSPQEIDYAAEIAKTEKKFNFVLFNYDDYPFSEMLNYINSKPENKDKFRMIDLSRIIFSGGKNEVEELRNKIINGQASFEEKADKMKKEKEFAEDVIEQYTYYYYELEDIVKGEAKKVIGLKTGELGEPIQIDENGKEWIIYRSEKEMREPDFNEPKMQQALKDYLKFKEMGIIQNYFEAKATEFKQTADSSGFTAACNKMGIAYYTTDFFPLNFDSLNFITSSISAQENVKKLIEPALTSQEFFIKAFPLRPGQTSKPVLLEKNIIVLHLTQEREITKEELDKIRTNYSNYKNFIFWTDLQTLLVKEKKLENRVQEGIEAYKKMMQNLYQR